MDIFAHLDIPDLVRAGSVCSSWRAAFRSLRSHGRYRRPQTPCLLYTSESDGDNIACLYSLAEKRVYKLPLPDPPIRNRYLIGSSNGWLVTADERSELHMVNPITAEQIALPSVTTIKQVKPIFDDSGAILEYEFSQYYGEEEIGSSSIRALDELRDYLYEKAFVFLADPSLGGYIVVLIHGPIGQLSFAKGGDCSWTWLPPSGYYEDCVYMDGLLYAVTSLGELEAFDLTGPTVSRKVIMEQTKDYIFERLYIVQAPSSNLLLVWRDQDVAGVAAEDDDVQELVEDRDYSGIPLETRKIMVYKIDMDAKELVETNSLQECVLFLGLGQSHCQCAEEYPQLKANHVYMTDDDQGDALRKSYRRDVGVFNLENYSTEEIVSPPLWSSWPAPIWITLSYTNLSSGSNTYVPTL
ncbi:hypothetical protein U9M48_027282 [Paspalum notatum var. saurae]|uniref:DUF295 domain-containing protein n=1 Tax=Paspalum notatum var. saurae TaxID=547442 RepID=A0AAQ3WZB5_PASNO